ncbi:MAG: hypothetical protein P0S96_06525 [Simkaniaceae bacterium]|nr:hypothetical protein [Candidatus Sacchlamyda saccharinae]
MLQFFRKHQKIFFVIVTFFIVISFSFFGTSSAISPSEKAPDREIGQLVDGSVLKEQKLYGLVRLLQNGIEEGGRATNLLNDSIVHKDMLLTGLGEILAEHNFEKLESELAERWRRAKNFSPYVHPFAPHISAKGIWSQMAPQINDLLEEVRKAPEEFSKEQLPLLFSLYCAQAEFPQPLLLQMLYYQQMQGGQVRPDPGLQNANVGLFGFQSIEDWFGAKFVEEVGKFILNAACIAREEGYSVKKDEAHIDMLRNVYLSLKMFDQENTPTNEQAQNAFTNQVRYLGLNDAEAIALWGEVLHFRRLFNEVGESVLLDRLALEQFKDFAKPLCQIKSFHLPSELEFHSFREMIKFQRYVELACEGDYLGLPAKTREAADIMNEHPELVFKPFKVEMSSVTKEEVAARISLKDTWQWESEVGNFVRLKEEFPVLADVPASSVEERMQALDDLTEMTRLNVDKFARLALVDAQPELVDEALQLAEKEKKTLKVRTQGGEYPLSGEHFLALLEGQDASLDHYSVDNETFYQIKVDEIGIGWHLLSYVDAAKDGTLDRLLDKLLEAANEELQLDDEEEVATKVYADLIKSISGDSLDDKPKHRFDRYLSEMRALAIKDEEAFAAAQEKALWPLSARTEERTEEAIAVEVGEFSEIENRHFYQFLSKEQASASEAEIAQARQHLKADAQQKLMRKLLTRG